MADEQDDTKQQKPDAAAQKGQEKEAEKKVKPSSPGETGTTPGTNWDAETGKAGNQ